MLQEIDTLEPNCIYCSTKLFEPYIKCVQCDNVYLCTLCFSKGAEDDVHKNQHDYSVIKNNFPLFDNCNWTAKEEYLLLKYIDEHGYGNWEEISKSMQTHSSLECQEHYKKFYIDDIQQNELPKLNNPDNCMIQAVQYPYLLKECSHEDPPRQYDSSRTQQIAGYNSYRSEFELNFDNNAESILALQCEYDDDTNDALMKHLQYSLVLAYNNKLKERKRRYEIIRNHGLIVIRKFFRWYKKFEETLGIQTSERLAAYMQLLSGTQFDAFIESLSMEKELEIHLHKLYEYRKNGLRMLKACKLYESMKINEETNNKDFRLYLSRVKLDWRAAAQGQQDWSSEVNLLTDPRVIKTNRCRKTAMPLQIIALPGYEKLTEKERAFCSTVRIIPENFLSFRDILVSENNKNGTLRLLEARRLIKIDVNKTRKLYDFLLAEGFISQPK